MNKRLFFSIAALVLTPTVATAQVPACGGTTGANAGAPGSRYVQAINPFLTAIVNGEACDLSQWLTTRDGKFWTLDTPELQFAAATVRFSGLYNSDPFISFGTTSTNLVAGPVTYAFLFGTPVVPGFYTTATSTGGVTVTNGLSGTSTVTTSAVYPTYISGYGTVGAVPTNLGVDLGTASCVAGPGTPFTVTNTCSQGTATNTFGPTFYDNLEALLTYTQDDIGSVVSWSGAVTLNAAVVPEPATITLMLTGLGLVGGLALRRRRNS
jgi:hypothetical protein